MAIDPESFEWEGKNVHCKSLGRLMTFGMLSILSATLFTACAGTKEIPEAFSAPMEQEDLYTIGISDILRVTVWKNEELSVAAVPVRPDGKISLPLVDDVQAEGLAAEELKAVVTERLSEYVIDPHVTVVVMQVNSRTAFVIGEVVRTGPVQVVQDYRITDALTAAGGFSPFANQRAIKVLRPTEDGMAEFVFNLKAFVKGKAPGTNILLQPKDTIVVSD